MTKDQMNHPLPQQRSARADSVHCGLDPLIKKENTAAPIGKDRMEVKTGSTGLGSSLLERLEPNRTTCCSLVRYFVACLVLCTFLLLLTLRASIPFPLISHEGAPGPTRKKKKKRMAMSPLSHPPSRCVQSHRQGPLLLRRDPSHILNSEQQESPPASNGQNPPCPFSRPPASPPSPGVAANAFSQFTEQRLRSVGTCCPSLLCRWSPAPAALLP